MTILKQQISSRAALHETHNILRPRPHEDDCKRKR